MKTSAFFICLDSWWPQVLVYSVIFILSVNIYQHYLWVTKCDEMGACFVKMIPAHPGTWLNYDIWQLSHQENIVYKQTNKQKGSTENKSRATCSVGRDFGLGCLSRKPFSEAAIGYLPVRSLNLTPEKGTQIGVDFIRAILSYFSSRFQEKEVKTEAIRGKWRAVLLEW